MENPVLNDDTAGDALRALGAQADAGIDTSSTNEQPETRAPGAEQPTDDNAAAPKADGENSDNPENKKPADKPPEEQKPAEQKEPSKYEKAKQREAEAWKKIEAEKAEIARQKADLERQRGQQPRQQPGPKQPTLKDERGYTAADYEEAAKGFDESGDEELAKAARQRAGALKQQEATVVQQGQRQQFEQTRKADLEAVVKAHPEFAPGGAKAQQMAELLGEFPELDSLPNCFTRAAQLFQLREQAGQVSGLKDRAEKAEKEVARLTGLMSINGGSPTQPAGGAKTFDQMSDAEQRNHLEREAQKADTAIW